MSARRLLVGLALLAGVVTSTDEAFAQSNWVNQTVNTGVNSQSYISVNNLSVMLGYVSPMMSTSSCPSCATLYYDSVTGGNQQIYAYRMTGDVSPGTELDIWANPMGGIGGPGNPCGYSFGMASFVGGMGGPGPGMGGGILVDGIHNATMCTADLSYSYYITNQSMLMPGSYYIDIQYTLTGF